MISAGTGRSFKFQFNARRSNDSVASSTIAIKSRSLPTPQLPRAYDPKYPRRFSSGKLRACSADQDRTARSTVLWSGHLRTGEFKDLSGIVDRIRALDRSVVLKRCSLRMPVGIARGNIETIQNLSFFHELVRNR
jgi:hypothetical protein